MCWRFPRLMVLGVVLAVGLAPDASAAVGMEASTLCELQMGQKWKKIILETLALFPVEDETQASAFVKLVGAHATTNINFRFQMQVDCFALPGGRGGTSRLTLPVGINPQVDPFAGVVGFDLPGSGPRDCFFGGEIRGKSSRSVRKRIHDEPDGANPGLSAGVFSADSEDLRDPFAPCIFDAQCKSGRCAPFDMNDPDSNAACL